MDFEALVPEIEVLFRGVRDRVREVFAQEPQQADRKDDGSLVTALDRELDERFSGGLLGLDPDWGVVSEEEGVVREGSPTWHLDPLDGTLNFNRRIPLFVCQAALMDGTDPLLAVIYDPLRDEFVWAGKGQGAWRDGVQVHVSERPLADALVLVDVARSGAFVGSPKLFPALRRAVFRIRALGCAGVHLRDVACGGADAFFGTRARPSPLYDVAPGVLVVREAGGVATTLDGGDALADRRSLLAAPAAIHKALLERVNAALGES